MATWDELSASEDEVANYTLVAFDNDISDLTKTPLPYYEITWCISWVNFKLVSNQ